MRKLYTLFLCFVFFLTAKGQEVVINEFMALNSSTLADRDGDYSDWIELFNARDASVSLEGWSITDNAGKPRKWLFPDISIPAGGYLVIFASGKDRADAGEELHTSFSLSGSGEYLGLFKPDGSVASEYAPLFPAQQTDVSYGLYLGQPTSMPTPTPGKPNQLGGLLAPIVSHPGGLQSEPIEVSLSVADPTLSIYYTLNGDRPTPRNGTLYEKAIKISSTTPLSAVTVNPDDMERTSPVVTRTYLFIDDIMRQPAEPEGYPMTWSYYNSDSTFYPADYGMDQAICQSSVYHNDMVEAFGQLPSVCIVTNPDYLFSISESPDSGGIYVHTGKSYKKIGGEWERPASVEWYDPKSGASFQINCGLRLHGGNSRNPGNSAKHSFRLSFRARYGASKLNFRLFDDEGATTRFDHLVLRAGYNYTWIKNGKDNSATAVQRTDAQYIYDSFAKNVQLAMGHPATHNRFVHLYLNGLYWGLYNISEKINNDFVQAYLGGNDEDYDVVGDHFEVIDGDDTIYNEMYDTATGAPLDDDGQSYQALVDKALLDIDNYIDYMLINWYIGNIDWDNNNWRAARSRVNPGRGFKYFVWDAESAFTNVNLNIVSKVEGQPTMIMAALMTNADFRRRVSERVQLHLTNHGPLSPEGAAEIYQRLADEIDKAIICESARWGDYRKMVGDTKKTFTRNDHWLPRLRSLLKNYFPKRTDILMKQLTDAGLYDPDMFNGLHDTASMATVYYRYSSDGQLHYCLPYDGHVSIDIFSADGRTVSHLTQQTHSGEVNSTPPLHLHKAMYILRITFGQHRYTGKFLVTE